MTTAVDYVRAGWALCDIPRGRKGPAAPGWQRRERAITTPEQAASLRENVGLCHAWSGTCAIDVDHYDVAKRWLAERGIDLDALIAAPDSVRISSGRPGRGKLLYRVPAGVDPLSLYTVKVAPYTVDDKTLQALEFRCATRTGNTVQDVLPPSIHPDTGQPYTWTYGNELVADWRCPPPLPAELLAIWRDALGPIVERVARAPIGMQADEIRALLAHHDPDAPYDDWIRIGMALHHQFSGHDDGLALWDEWSSRGTKYRGTADLEGHWRSFGNHPDPVTLASLTPPRVASPDDFDTVDEAELLVDMSPKPERFQFLTRLEAKQLPRPSYIVHELLPAGDVGAIYGQPGSGKTFVALDLCYAVALGRDWRDKSVKPGGVLYVAAEDDSGVRMRMDAYELAHGIDPGSVPILTLCDAPNVMDKDTQRDLLLAIRDAAARVDAKLVVLDTLASVTPGADENSAKDMTVLIDWCKRVHKATGALVLLVHHEGKTEGKGPRGSSALHGAFCVELLVEQYDDIELRNIVVQKLKNGPKGAVYTFRLDTVVLEAFDPGEPVTSCVVTHVEESMDRGAPRRKKLGEVEQIVVDVLQDLTPLGGDSRVAVSDVIEETSLRLPHDPTKRDQRRARAKRALESLQCKNILQIEADMVVLT